MHYGVKLAAAGVVLLGGISLALLFRHKPEPAAYQGNAPGDHLVLRRRIEPPQPTQPLRPQASASSTAPVPVSPPAPNRVTFLMPMDRGQTPPSLARDFPPCNLSVSEADAKSANAAQPKVSEDASKATTHRIVDGDSLESLAMRYLGSAERAAEILAANRDSLPNPAVLPIGLELSIPPRAANPSPEGNLMPKRELIPVAKLQAETKD